MYLLCNVYGPQVLKKPKQERGAIDPAGPSPRKKVKLGVIVWVWVHNVLCLCVPMLLLICTCSTNTHPCDSCDNQQKVTRENSFDALVGLVLVCAHVVSFLLCLCVCFLLLNVLLQEGQLCGLAEQYKTMQTSYNESPNLRPLILELCNSRPRLVQGALKKSITVSPCELQSFGERKVHEQRKRLCPVMSDNMTKQMFYHDSKVV